MDYGRFVEQQKQAEMERRYPLSPEGFEDTGVLCEICGAPLSGEDVEDSEIDGEEFCGPCRDEFGTSLRGN